MAFQRTGDHQRERNERARREGDPRIVYGARCVWWDSIANVATKPGSGLPCCPFCGGVLFELESEAQWWANVDSFDANQPGYRKFIEWLRGKCFPTAEIAREHYDLARAVEDKIQAALQVPRSPAGLSPVDLVEAAVDAERRVLDKENELLAKQRRERRIEDLEAALREALKRWGEWTYEGQQVLTFNPRHRSDNERIAELRKLLDGEGRSDG